MPTDIYPISDEWHESHDSLITVARWADDQAEWGETSQVVDFFEKPWRYTNLARRAYANLEVDLLGAAHVARRLPAHTRVMFAVEGSKPCVGLTRDIPRGDGEEHLTRRITVLDFGSEFFVSPTTEFTRFEVTEFDSNG